MSSVTIFQSDHFVLSKIYKLVVFCDVEHCAFTI